MKSILALCTVILMATFFGVGVEAATGSFELGVAASAVSLGASFVPMPKGVSFMAINIADVVTEFGGKYIDQGQSFKTIKKKLFSPSRTAGFFRRLPEDNDVYRSVYATVNEVLQAFGIPFNAKSTTTFKPWEQKLGRFKIDELMEPDRFENSFLGFLQEIKKEDRSKWVILTWWIQNMLLTQTQEDFEKEVAYYGWQFTGFNASPTVNGATFVRELAAENAVLPANASMDGIRTQIIKMVDQSRANVVSTGALEADAVDFCAQVEDFVKSIELKLQRKIDYIFMDKRYRDRYRDGKREKYSLYYKDDEDLSLIKDTTVRVEWLESMDGSDKLWGTPANNRIRPLHKANSGRFDVQKADRAVKVLTDWKELLTFDVPEFVVTNDLENTISAGDISARY